jgi:primosomal protein N' (replication factor Y) (superfamily II helicase)
VSGPAVDVAVLVPRLELDRPFTYRLPDDVSDATGHVVSVPFHGRTVHGYVLGQAHEVPPRVLPVRRILSRVPVVDLAGLDLARWMAERYVVPLATAIAAMHPPRVSGEEDAALPESGPTARPSAPPVLTALDRGSDLVDALREDQGVFVVRPLPGDEGAACLEAVAACLDGGRDAVVVVPESEPLPATARVVLDAFGEAAVEFGGGEPRDRYRTWLEMRAGRYRVVVGTRPAVFAPVGRLGLVWIHREVHPAHREERAPYYRTRDVALARSRLEGAVAVLSSLSPSADAVAAADRGEAIVVRAPRALERERAPLVEVARPEAEDRSPRLTELLRAARGAFLLLSRRGYGVARNCRSCGEPARCGVCGGTVVMRGGGARCVTCGADAVCPNCGGTRFGIERGGTERLQEWAARLADVPVLRIEEGAAAVPPPVEAITVGTAAEVKDFGPVRLDLVAVLDADRARRRAGLTAPEQVLATWHEAAAWAAPRSSGARVLVHTREPSDTAVQALVRWDPWHFHRAEGRRREEAGFPPGFPVFRVAGGEAVVGELRALEPAHLLSSGSGNGTVCLVTLRPEDVARFRARVLELVGDGVVTRVEAEPQP